MKKSMKLVVMAVVLVFAMPIFAAGTTTIELWSFLDPNGDSVRSKGVKHVIDTFEKKYPDIKVEVSVIAWNQIGAAVLRAARAGKTPDVAMLNSAFIRKPIAAKAIQPIDKYLDKMSEQDRNDLIVIPTSIDAQGRNYGIGYELRAFGLVYRTDLLNKFNLTIPDSLEELAETAKKLQDAVGKKDFMGIAISYDPAADRAVKNFLPLIYGLGAKVLNEDGTANFNSPQAVRVLNYLHDLVYKYKVLPLDVALMNSVQVMQLSQAGRVGFLLMGTHWLNAIRQKAAPGAKFSWMPFPSFGKGNKSAGLMECWDLTIPRAAKHPDDAWKLIEHWISPEIQLWQAKNIGYIPMRVSLGDDPSFDNPNATHIKPTLKYMAAYPLKFEWPESTDVLQDTLGHAITAVLSNKMTPVEALIEAEKNYNSMKK